MVLTDIADTGNFGKTAKPTIRNPTNVYCECISERYFIFGYIF